MSINDFSNCIFSGRLCRQLFARQSDLDEAAGIRHGLLVEEHAEGTFPRTRRLFRRYRNVVAFLDYFMNHDKIKNYFLLFRGEKKVEVVCTQK